MKNYIKILTLFLVGFSLSSCETLFMQANPSTAPTAIFDEAWTFADQEYSFFEFKNIDWQAVYDNYRPQVNDDMDEEELFEVIANMLYELRDGHVNLRSSFDRSRNWTWFLNSPPNFSYDILERNYFQEEQQFVGAFVIYDFGDIGYIRYSSFSSGVSESAMDYILEKFKDRDGIIIDIRDNGGGSITNIDPIASRFAPERVLIGRTRYKNGPGRNEFSDWDEDYLSPYGDDEDNPIRFTKPVAVLTNRSSYSASTFFTQHMRELPNVTTIGDWTGGGGGAPSFTELANGWNLRVSTTQLEAPDGFNVEDGIPPDVAIDMDSTDIANGVDTILEEALRLLRE